MNVQPWPRVVIVAAFLVAVVAGVYTSLLIYEPVIKPILDVAPPFVIGLILAFLLDPLIDRFGKRGMSRSVAVAIVGLSFLIVFLLAGFLLVPKIADQASQLTKNYSDYVSQAQSQLNTTLHDHAPLLKRLHLPTTSREWTRRFSGQLEGVAGTSISFVANAFTSALSRILWLIIIPLSTVWFLRDFDYMKAKVAHFTPERYRERVVHLGSAVGGVFGQYVRGMITVAFMFSLASMAILSALGLEYGLVIGAVAGLFYLVPYVGVLIISVITGFAALVQPGHGAAYPLVLMAILVFQSYIVFDLFVTPKVVGGSLGVHPVLSLFSLALGARMFGVVGMIAAVPVAASLQVALGQLYPSLYEMAERTKEEVALVEPPVEAQEVEVT